jgi:hypothetical protein
MEAILNSEEEVVVEDNTVSNEGSKEETNSTVSLYIKKSMRKPVVNNIVSANQEAHVHETDGHYVITAPYIRVTRSMVESALGNITDAQWRMTFLRREGDVRAFNDYEFQLGTPAIQVEEQNKTDYVQINTRIPKEAKIEMECYLPLLNMSQTEYIAKAVELMNAQIREELK